MRYIPTVQEPEALKAAYKAAYGDNSDDFKNERLDWLEFRLLDEAYQNAFGDCIGNMTITDLKTLNMDIRRCLETNTPYDDGLPEGAIV